MIGKPGTPRFEIDLRHGFLPACNPKIEESGQIAFGAEANALTCIRQGRVQHSKVGRGADGPQIGGRFAGDQPSWRINGAGNNPAEDRNGKRQNEKGEDLGLRHREVLLEYALPINVAQMSPKARTEHQP